MRRRVAKYCSITLILASSIFVIEAVRSNEAVEKVPDPQIGRILGGYVYPSREPWRRTQRILRGRFFHRRTEIRTRGLFLQPQRDSSAAGRLWTARHWSEMLEVTFRSLQRAAFLVPIFRQRLSVNRTNQ